MKMHSGLAVFSSLALLACTEQAPTTDPAEAEMVILQEPAADFAGQMQQLAQDYFALRPETATYYGVPDEKAGVGISSRLARYSVEGEIERRAGLKAILDELAAIDAIGYQCDDETAIVRRPASHPGVHAPTRRSRGGRPTGTANSSAGGRTAVFNCTLSGRMRRVQSVS